MAPRFLRGRLVPLVLLAAVVAAPGEVAGARGRGHGARRGGGRPGSRRCGCGCGGGVQQPPPPPPPSPDCSACPVGQYLETACTSTRNRVCASCSTRAGNCAAEHFLSGCGSENSVSGCPSQALVGPVR
jgi:hypothetical protein